MDVTMVYFGCCWCWFCCYWNCFLACVLLYLCLHLVLSLLRAHVGYLHLGKSTPMCSSSLWIIFFLCMDLNRMRHLHLQIIYCDLLQMNISCVASFMLWMEKHVGVSVAILTDQLYVFYFFIFALLAGCEWGQDPGVVQIRGVWIIITSSCHMKANYPYDTDKALKKTIYEYSLCMNKRHTFNRPNKLYISVIDF